MAGEIQLNSTTMATESSGTITLSNVNSATNRTNLGLGSIATQAVDSVSITGGTIGSGVVFPTGHILQVLQGNYSTQTSSSSSTFTDTGLSASITPSSSSNKILVLVNHGKCRKNGATQLGLKLFRGATEILAYEYLLDTNDSGTRQEDIITFSCFDSPTTTSSLTYKTQFNNGQSVSSVVLQNQNSTAFIVLMEIAA